MKKCSYCGYNQLSGMEKNCPKCNSDLIYKCKKCGKELINGKKNKCPLCIGKTKRLIGGILSGTGLLSGIPGGILTFLYFVIPVDAIPDPSPAIGFLDDLLLALGVLLFSGGIFIAGIVLLAWGIIIAVKLSEKVPKESS